MPLSTLTKRVFGSTLALAVLVAVLLNLPSFFDSLNLQRQKAQLVSSGSPSSVSQLNQELINANITKSFTEESTKNLVEVASHRSILMELLAEKNPASFLYHALTPEQTAYLPKSVVDHVEKKISTSGYIDVYHVDDFDNPEKSYHEYFFRRGTVKKPLYLVGDLEVRSNTPITLTGYEKGGFIVAAVSKNTIVINKTAASTVNRAVGEQKTAVILVDYANSVPRPFTREQAHGLFFGGAFNKFIREASYGKTYFSGDVYGWFTLPGAPEREGGNGRCLPPNQSAVMEAVRTNNISLAPYSRIVVAVHSCYRAAGFSQVESSDYALDVSTYHFSYSVVSLAGYSNPSMWGSQPFPWTNLDFLLAHELGHALGLWHASSLDCDVGSIPEGNATCNHVEYGNRYDMMGSGSRALHYNGYYKELLDWLPPSSILTITQSGEYLLRPLELNPLKVKGPQLAKIKALGFDVTPYALEYRRGVGFDVKLNEPALSLNRVGLFVNRIVKKSGTVFTTQLLDMKPLGLGVTADLDHVTLNRETITVPTSGGTASAGYLKTFVDVSSGITIGPVIQASSSGISFKASIKAPTCVRAQPTVTFDNKPDSLVGGNVSGVSLKVVNNNSFACPLATMDITVQAPSAEWLTSSSQGTVAVASGDAAYPSTPFQVPSTAAAGVYTVTYTVRDTTSGLTVSLPMQLRVTGRPAISSVTPSLVRVPGDEVIIQGSNFPQSGTHYVLIESIPSRLSVRIPFTGSSQSANEVRVRFPQEMIDSSALPCLLQGVCSSTPTPSQGRYAVSLYIDEIESNIAHISIGDQPVSDGYGISVLWRDDHNQLRVLFNEQGSIAIRIVTPDVDDGYFNSVCDDTVYITNDICFISVASTMGSPSQVIFELTFLNAYRKATKYYFAIESRLFRSIYESTLRDMTAQCVSPIAGEAKQGVAGCYSYISSKNRYYAYLDQVALPVVVTSYISGEGTSEIATSSAPYFHTPTDSDVIVVTDAKGDHDCVDHGTLHIGGSYNGSGGCTDGW